MTKPNRGDYQVKGEGLKIYSYLTALEKYIDKLEQGSKGVRDADYRNMDIKQPIKHVYTHISFITNDGEKLTLCMRDSGYEIHYQGFWYEANKGNIKLLTKAHMELNEQNEFHPMTREKIIEKYTYEMPFNGDKWNVIRTQDIEDLIKELQPSEQGSKGVSDVEIEKAADESGFRKDWGGLKGRSEFDAFIEGANWMQKQPSEQPKECECLFEEIKISDKFYYKGMVYIKRSPTHGLAADDEYYAFDNKAKVKPLN